MVKYIIIFLVCGVLGYWFFFTGTEGIITKKTAKTTYGDSVYFFRINESELEVSRYSYRNYKLGDFYTQGLFQ